MKRKKIANIVFYKFFGENGARKQACIFYNDGTVKSCSYEEAISACLEVAREEGISSKEEFAQMINSNRVHVMSGYDFERNFQKYVVKEIEEVKEAEQQDVLDDFKVDDTKEANGPKTEVTENTTKLGTKTGNNANRDINVYELADDYDKEQERVKVDPIGIPVPPINNRDFSSDYVKPVAGNDKKKENLERLGEEKVTNSNPVKPANVYSTKNKEDIGAKQENIKDTKEDSDYKEASDSKKDNFTANNGSNAYRNSIKSATPTKKEGFFKRQFNKLKKFFKKQKVRLTAIALAFFVGGAGLGHLAANNHESKVGNMISNTIEKLTPGNKDKNLVYGNNDYYDDYTFEQLQEVNTVESQKTAMKKLYDAIKGFNDKFANSHLEVGKDVKAALSFEEIVALQQAYNDYTDEEIRAIFNGTKITATDLSNAYKNGTLQLMGAHVIETRENPVDMSVILNTEEGKEFYQKYHEIFLQMKEAEGQDQIDKVNAFYREIYKDFPISDDIREIGISHSEGREMIESYKLSITPMVAAAEMMYQNLDIDHTLSDKAIAYFNDLGFCNYAEDKFENIGIVTTLQEEDNTQPLYEQYKYAIVNELTEENNYVIDDAHRDLSQLDAFQMAVNNHGHSEYDGEYVGGTSYTTETYTDVDTHTVTTTNVRKEKEKIKTSDRDKAVASSSEEAVKKAEDKVRKQDEKDNEEAKRKAEKEAEEKRQQLQEEADREAEKNRQEVQKDDQDLQQDIEDANDRIDKNNADDNTANDVPVNESDFGDHNVDFDDNHSDANGNLDDSVKDITTDSSNDQSNQDLPDPNQTGAQFEQSYPETQATPEYPNTADPDPVVPEEVVDNETSQNVIEYEEPVEETPQASGIELTNEDIVDRIIEEMANNNEAFEEGYQFVYTR